MPKQTFLSRFDIIIKRLERSPATYDEIVAHLKMVSDFGDNDFIISKRTLQRDIKDIYKQLGIEIKNKRKGDNRYYIVQNDDDIEASKRILDGFQINNAIAASKNNDNIILLEQRKANGIEHFSGLLFAIKNKRKIKFTHQKYYEIDSTFRTVHPLALKENLGIWYLLAVDNKYNILKSFGLDRISELDILKTKFKEKYNYDFKTIYKNSFGIITLQNKQPEQVVLSFNYEQGMYIKNNPLHHTQQLLLSNKKTLVFEYKIYTTYDFIMEILKYGSEVKVLQPLSLVKEIKSILTKNLKQYE